MILLAFRAWQQYPDQMKEERKKEERLEKLRKRVSEILPDFQAWQKDFRPEDKWNLEEGKMSMWQISSWDCLCSTISVNSFLFAFFLLSTMWQYIWFARETLWMSALQSELTLKTELVYYCSAVKSSRCEHSYGPYYLHTPTSRHFVISLKQL